MCGICGVFEYSTKTPVDDRLLREMVGTIRHRGPDDVGQYTTPDVGLAMARLSVIDVAGGHQPITNETGDVWIVLNGEIYNYQELRNELLGKGHRFQTKSDTEVVLHAYEEYGADCVNVLDGMFAFAIHDARGTGKGGEPGRPGRLLLARDRLGKKPLYYSDCGGALIFGSELKPLLRDPRVGKDLDHEALSHYLSLLVIPAPFSIFKSIRKLPAGCLLECDANGPRIRRYWNYLDFVGERRIPEEEAVAEIRRLLFAAVEKRLIAEVPLGAFLSGGLDSSVVVAIMSRLKEGPVKTFSIGFEGPSTANELPYARILADYYRTDHHEYLVQPDIVEIVPEIVHYADEPFAISSAIPTLLLSRHARREVTVVLTGDGGDEIFGGYGSYVYERWAAAYRTLPRVVDRMFAGTAGLIPGRVDGTVGRARNRVLRFVANARKSPGLRRLGWASAYSAEEKEEFLLPFNGAAAQSRSTAQFLEEQIREIPSFGSDVHGNCMDVLVWLADEMLAKVDRMTMAASLEARSPLLDWHLTEYLAGLSFGMKVPGWRESNLKHLLRRATADLIPPALLTRRKQGFNVPFDAWFRGGARQYLESKLSPDRLRRRGVFNADAVSSLLARHQAGQINASNRLYALLIFETWAEEYL